MNAFRPVRGHTWGGGVREIDVANTSEQSRMLVPNESTESAERGKNEN